jgi:D-alanyl-D-alanine carboxypeptidase
MTATPMGRRRGSRAAALSIVVGVATAACATVAPASPLTGASLGAPGASGSEAAPNASVLASVASAPAATTPSLSTPSPSPSARAPGSSGSGDLTAVQTAALQAAIARFIQTSGTPGASVTIRWPDGRTWSGTAGLADVAHRTPVRPDTAFAIGSMSKTFTSAVVLQLVDEGKVGLEVPVARYLPAQHLNPKITVRMLLDHTSGLFDVFLAPGIDKALQSSPRRRWTVARALTYEQKPYFPPGKGWRYSNTNYLLLGLLVERVTGHSLASEIDRRFLVPLGLTHTWTQAVDPPAAALAHGYRLTGSHGTLKQRDLSDASGTAPFTSIVTAIDGAGALASTSGDLAKWAADLYAGSVLSAEMLDAMTADRQRTVAYIPGVLYGLGVQTYAVGPWTTLGHSGRVLGFRGGVRYLPGQGISIAALTNQSRSNVTPLVAGLLAIVLPPPIPSTRSRAR